MNGESALLAYWPIILFGLGTFFGSIGVAIGLTMWIMGRLSEQDARRIELKEAILLEIRTQAKETTREMQETRHTLRGRIEQQWTVLDEKIDSLKGSFSNEMREMSDRLTRVEAHMENSTHLARSS